MDTFGQLWALSIAAIATLAGCCFAILAPPQFLAPMAALCLTFIGFLGTSMVSAGFLAVSRRPASWAGLGFKRNIVLLAILLAWLAGGVTGFIAFYVIPRSSG